MKILVPVDGSKFAIHATEIASDLAKGMNAEVTLLSVTPTVSDMEVDYTAGERETLDRKLTEYAEKVLGQAQSALKAKGIEAKTSIMQSNSVADAVIAAAADSKTDLIVIGSRGLGATARLVMGGVSLRVVTHAPCSVLVVRTAE